ncbi:MAG: hypothetical protein EPN93_10590 [Spirochaetes bacterium]|nr:MAG: hypothetical protein EPN93_10590 [Spirochaetota bacterium]
MRKALILFFAALLIVSGCATLSKSDIPAPADLVKLEPQKIDIAYDVMLLRVDLQRQFTSHTRTVSSTDSKGQTTTRTETYQVPVPYHYLGVDMGNGLFLDANMNLSLNLFQLLGIRKDQDFTIVRKGRGFFSSDTKFIKEGSKLTIDFGGLFSSKTEIEMKDNNARFKGGILSSDQDITVENDRITYDPHGMFEGWSKSQIVNVGSGASIPGFWKDTMINKNKDGSINLGEALVVRHEGNKVVFKYAGWFGTEHVFTMVRTNNKIVYYDDNMNGVMIEIASDRVKTKSSGGEEEFIITKK